MVMLSTADQSSWNILFASEGIDWKNQFVTTCKGVDKHFGYCHEASVKLAPTWVEGDVYTVSLWTYMEPTDQPLDHLHASIPGTGG